MKEFSIIGVSVGCGFRNSGYYVFVFFYRRGCGGLEMLDRLIKVTWL